MIRNFKRYYLRNHGLKGTTRSVINVWRKAGFKGLIARSLQRHGEKTTTDYQYWIDNVEKQYSAYNIDKLKSTFKRGPKISVLVPVYNVPESYLRACLDSVFHQYYENWELCIADDRSKGRHIKRVLSEYAEKDKRVKVVFREKNGHIAEATNSALALATGKYIALLDNDDLLKPEALLEVASFIARHPDADMIYSDEDRISADGQVRTWPSFKPDWSPDLFLTRMYVSHLCVYRTSMARELGGMRSEFDGSQDYDFALRFTEQTENIYHIPKILYHWRMIPGSTALNTSHKNYAFLASVRAKEAAAKRRGYNAIQVVYPEKMATQMVFYPAVPEKVSILMFLVDQKDVNLAQETLSNMRKHSKWEYYEILIGMNHPNMAHFFSPQEKLQFFVYEDASVNEMFVHLYRRATGQFIVFIQPGFIIKTDDWLEFTLGQARLAQTGLVGGLIYNMQGYIEENGLIALAEHTGNIHLKRAHYGFHYHDMQTFDNLQFNANFLMLGNRFVMFEKAKAEHVGINETTVSFTDFIFLLGLRLYSKGYFNVYRSDVQILNKKKEKVPVVIALSDNFMDALSTNEQAILAHDPFYNLNFDATYGNYQLRLR